MLLENRFPDDLILITFSKFILPLSKWRFYIDGIDIYLLLLELVTLNFGGIVPHTIIVLRTSWNWSRNHGYLVNRLSCFKVLLCVISLHYHWAYISTWSLYRSWLVCSASLLTWYFTSFTLRLIQSLGQTLTINWPDFLWLVVHFLLWELLSFLAAVNTRYCW